jgi:integrase
VQEVPTLPFDADEWSRILSALDRYPQRHRDRTEAFVLLLRWSGLRIRDVVSIEWPRIANVSVPLPPDVIDAVKRLAKVGRHPFWSGNGLAKSAVAAWQRALRYARCSPCRTHRSRTVTRTASETTSAVDLLLKRVDLQDVSTLLGHSSVKIAERHYAPWVQARQDRLDSIVRRAWVTPPAPSE